MILRKLLNFFVAVVLFVILFTGCDGRKAPATFSTVFRTDFDPISALHQAGYEVRTAPGSKGVTNPEYGYAWRSWEGVLIVPDGKEGCEPVAVAIRDTLSKATSNLDELTNLPGRKPGQPLTGMLRYNKDEMHGDMHIWLLPDEMEKVISFVIFLREEKLE